MKEFANSGHLDSIAVCLTTAVLWLLTRRCEATANSLLIVRRRIGPSAIDWLASVLWAGAVLAKLYPLVLAPILLAHWWRRLRWRTTALLALFLLVVVSGYAALPPAHRAALSESVAFAEHSSFSGLGEFASRWEMNDLLFSAAYENLRPIDDDGNSSKPWYSVAPQSIRQSVNQAFGKLASAAGWDVPASSSLRWMSRDVLPFFIH